MSPLGEILVSTALWASLSTLIVMLIGTPVAYALARYTFPGKPVISALTSLPLVLPPTAVGYLLLRLLADNGPLGEGGLGFDPDILLTWKGVIVAYGVMSFPLFVRTARVSFEAIDPRLEDVARTLGDGPLRVFWRVTLPLATRGLLAGMILAFTRALGEFGATVMVAGNIPGQTQTLASAIYSAQQAGNDAQANLLLL
ncbi:MAG: molybdate ABC transporter permease subunit, partial [Verrucomicrobiota bacterium]